MNRWLIYNILLTAAALGVSLYLGLARPDLMPDKVPTHWGISGDPDAWASRDEALPYLLILPGVMAGVVLLSLALPWLSPQQFSIERFRGTYNFLMAVVVTLFAYIHGVALAASLGADIDVTRTLLAGVFLFLAIIGSVLGKVERNFYVGIRTPWTLADDTVWKRTHHLGAWLWTVGSLICFAAVLAGVSLWWSVAGILILAFVPIVYSLVLYKRLERLGKLSK